MTIAHREYQPLKHKETMLVHEQNYKKTKAFFLEKGWTVIEGKRQHAVRVETNELQCGDGRYANLPPKERKAGRAIFGATWGVAAMKTGGEKEQVQEAVRIVKNHGMIPAIHGDHHGPLVCGLRKLWMAGSVAGLHPHQLDESAEQQVIASEGIRVTQLPGEHEETKLAMTFIPGMAPKLDKHAFRQDATLPQDLEIDFDTFLAGTEQAIGQLTQGKVKTVELIK